MRCNLLTRSGIGGGLAALLVLSSSAAGQDYQLSSMSRPSYTSGNRYVVGPSIMPAGAYYPGTGYSTINKGYYGVSLPALSDNNLTRSGIFMTSINYPGIYGAYAYGITPQAYSYRAGPELYPSVSPTSSLGVYNPVKEELSTALIDVRVPDNADLYFNGTRTTQPGESRFFITPPLKAGQDYTYEVRAQWPDGNRTVKQSKPVHIKAGDHIKVDFSEAPAESTLRNEYPSTGMPRLR